MPDRAGEMVDLELLLADGGHGKGRAAVMLIGGASEFCDHVNSYYDIQSTLNTQQLIQVHQPSTSVT